MTVLRKNFTLSALVVLLSVTISCASDPTALGVGSVEPSDSSEPVIEAGPGVGTEMGELDVEPAAAQSGPAPEQAMALGLIENVALLFIAENNGSTGLSVSSSARFYTITTPLSNDPVLKDMNILDSCEVGSESSQVNASALNLPIDHIVDAGGNEVLQVDSVSAGDTAELVSGAGSFVSLLQATVDDSVQYAVQDGTDLNMEIPNELTMNVAGDVFPQLTSSWTTPLRLDSGLQDAVRSIDAGSVLNWTGSSSADSVQSRLHIYAGFLNELTGEYKSFQCELEDDGEFNLPEDVQALYQGGLSANFVDVARYTRSIQMVDGVSVVNVFVQSF